MGSLFDHAHQLTSARRHVSGHAALKAVAPGAERNGWVLLIAAHVRIRMLLVVAVVIICGGVFAVTELQRRSDAVSFEEYAAIRELRNATMQMALTFDEARIHGAGAGEEVESSERALTDAIAGAGLNPDAHTASERELVDAQTRIATGVAELAKQALAGRPREDLEARRDVLLDRFIARNDELLQVLTAEREQARSSAARRPVLLVLALFLVFGFLHLLLVERPASRERRRRRAHAEFVSAMQVALRGRGLRSARAARRTGFRRATRGRAEPQQLGRPPRGRHPRRGRLTDGAGSRERGAGLLPRRPARVHAAPRARRSAAPDMRGVREQRSGDDLRAGARRWRGHRSGARRAPAGARARAKRDSRARGH